MKDVMVYKMNEKITVIGPAIIDVLAGPINENLFKAGTMPMDNIKLYKNVWGISIVEIVTTPVR